MRPYQQILNVTFVERENRFIATCLYEGKKIRVHVKNTGRCKELLLPGVSVAVDFAPSPKRKTDYDLVAVKKKDRWINIDSQLPNKLVKEALGTGQIKWAEVPGEFTHIQPEKTFGDSRFDFYVENAAGVKGIIEVKGVTLEQDGYAAFPDAPSIRALKHVTEMTELVEKGVLQGMLLFVVQMADMKSVTIYEKMQPALQVAVAKAIDAGVRVQAYACAVTPAEIHLTKQIPFVLTQDWPVEK